MDDGPVCLVLLPILSNECGLLVEFVVFGLVAFLLGVSWGDQETHLFIRMCNTSGHIPSVPALLKPPTWDQHDAYNSNISQYI